MPRYMDFEYERVNSEITIEKYHGSKASVNIPSKIKGLPVTEIGVGAFFGCRSLTSIVIPDSVTTIGHDAFSICGSLKSITIPDSVTSIGDHAFDGCESLKSITIPDSVTSIGDNAFEACFSLTSIVIPDSVTSIGDNAFAACSSLTSIVIPDSVTSIGDCAFIGCKSLTSIVIPDSVTSIGDFAFSDCSLLTNITIPDSVTSIGDNAFNGCESLKSITIPDSVTSIDSSAFEDCSSLTSIYFPRSLKNSLKSFCNDYGNKIRYYNSPTKFFIKINRLQNASNLPDDIRTSVKQIETLNYSNKYTGAMNSQINKILDDFITIQELQQKIETNSVINLITLVNGVSQKKITNALEYIKPFNDEIDKIKVAAQENLRVLTEENEANSNDFKYTRTRSGIQIDKYVGSDSFVVIPEQIENLPVTAIGYRAFDNSNLYKVIIPASVQTIVYAAFVSQQPMHVLFKGYNIQMIPQSFLAPQITFYCARSSLVFSLRGIINNNPKCHVSYNAADFYKA